MALFFSSIASKRVGFVGSRIDSSRSSYSDAILKLMLWQQNRPIYFREYYTDIYSRFSLLKN